MRPWRWPAYMNSTPRNVRECPASERGGRGVASRGVRWSGCLQSKLTTSFGLEGPGGFVVASTGSSCRGPTSAPRRPPTRVCAWGGRALSRSPAGALRNLIHDAMTRSGPRVSMIVSPSTTVLATALVPPRPVAGTIDLRPRRGSPFFRMQLNLRKLFRHRDRLSARSSSSRPLMTVAVGARAPNE